ncbi:putative Uracil-regulated protein 1 [Glarea lozoyensis 74030]|uniref:Putative Uracil-regulated protein 1 n=1 Tax=Glarea lozoyensis (strain ATCC 74030 / MF5533) TaxID=1104152 RepID=H0EIG8_GLAL7|nr:putative Uracil-regulated protein 1 [Glarea lozoyensis 74030]
MSSTPPDQNAMMKEVLDALKNLQVNQVQLASNVDAITGRVNVLAGMKEVRDAAVGVSNTASSKSTEETPSTPKASEALIHDQAVPTSPSLPVDQIKEIGSSTEVSQTRKPGVTSRIILTVPDGKVCLNESGELAVTKFAVEPVWYLPGVAERFGIGGLTVYCFGDPAKMSDENVRLALRIHDEYLVYNARKRGLDRASEYFKRTENIAGVKDMRFQALMPDILHWLGIKKIDRMLSMSNMKHDAIVSQGIPIHERVELPESWIPADSRVEIDAKITAGELSHIPTLQIL